MGVEARIVLFSADTALAERAARAAFRRIADLDSVLSDYRVDSELSRLSDAAGRFVPVGNDLFAVLSMGQVLAEETGGAFDLTSGRVVALWRNARREAKLPTDSALCVARRHSGWRHLTLDSAARTARVAEIGVRLDAGAIGKGYAADAALGTLREASAARAMVAIGGDMVVGDPPPGLDGWTIAIETDSGPRELVLVSSAISTSGDAEQFVEIGGVRYSHVVNPLTGLGLTSGETATVVAPRGVDADAWATAVTVLAGPARAAFIAARPAASFYVRGGTSAGISAAMNASTACRLEPESR